MKIRKISIIILLLAIYTVYKSHKYNKAKKLYEKNKPMCIDPKNCKKCVYYRDCFYFGL